LPRCRTEQVKVLILIMDADRRIYAAKPDTYVGSLAKAEAENPAEGFQARLAPIGYVLPKALSKRCGEPGRHPDHQSAPAPAPKLSEVLTDVPGYSDLDAVTTGKVHELDVDFFLQAPGPRVVEAMRVMFSLLYGTTPTVPGE
jgi:ABC-type Fe3+-hydroxamate transport system substrate-binding protein